MGDVNISLANGQLGNTLQTADGICGLVCTGNIDEYPLGEPMLVTSLRNALSQGVTEESSGLLYKQIKEFYDEAGDGAQLYLLPLANTMTLGMICDRNNANGAKKLLDYAQGKIKMLGVTVDSNVYDSVSIDFALNEDVYAAADNMRLLARDYFLSQKPFRAVIAGLDYTGVAGDLTNIMEGGINNRTAILIGDTESGGGACVGLLLGRIARTRVEEKISKVRNGPIASSTAYLGDTAVDDPSVESDPAIIDGMGFITLRTRVRQQGFYFTDDHTASATTDDYHGLSRGRIVDKAHRIAYDTYVQYVDDEIDTIAGGKPDPGAAKDIEQKIINALAVNMVAQGNIVEAQCRVPLDQNVTSTERIKIEPRVRPKGYLKFIDIELGYVL